MQNSLSYKLGLKNDNNRLFIARKTLVQRQELSKKYNNESQVVLVFEPHRFMTQYWAGAGPQQPMFAVGLSKDDPVENISTILKKKLQSVFHKDFQKYTYFLLCNNYLLSSEQTIGMIYEKYKNEEDGILYVKYCEQQTFGTC